MFGFMGCRCDIIRHTRISRDSHQGGISSVHPIKIELKCTSDASIILSRARCLSGDAYYAGVHISKWLSEEEMNDVKILCRKCDELNPDHSSSKDRKRFIVISEKIMKRKLNGWLQVYNSTSSSKESSSVNTKPSRQNLPVTSRISFVATNDKLSQSKNAVGGSQVAPI